MILQGIGKNCKKLHFNRDVRGIALDLNERESEEQQVDFVDLCMSMYLVDKFM